MKTAKVLRNAGFFRALGEPARLQIVKYLLERGDCQCICHIAELIGRDQSVAFRHIGILREAGIIRTKKDGKFLLCSLAEPQMIKKILED